MSETSRHTRLIVIGLLLTAGVFLLDLSLPLGVASGVPYVAVVLLSLWLPHRRYTLIAATLATFLTVLGAYLSPHGGVIWVVVTNRLLAIFAIWITAILSLHRKRSQEKLRGHRDQLEELVENWTATLKESEGRYRGIFNNMSSGVAVYAAIDDGADFEFVDFNPAVERNEKLAREDVMGRRVTSVFPGVEEFGLLDVLRRVWRTGQPELHPATLYRDDRIQGWRENYVYRISSGEVVAFYEDMTERKQAEEALVESEALNRSILEAMPDLMFRLSREGVHLDFHASSQEELYAPMESIVGKSVADLLPDTVARDYMTCIERTLETRSIGVFEYELDLPGKGRQCYEARLVPCRDLSALALVRNITDHKMATEALRQSEERLSQIAETIEDVFWITDWETYKTLFASRAYERIWGRPLEDLYADSRNWADAIHEEDRERAWENFVQLGEGNSYDEEYRIVRPDGSLRWIRDRGFPVRDSSGQIYRVAGIAQDVTERKQAEAALRASEERLELAVRGTSDGLWDWDIETGDEYWSPRFKEMLGYADDEIDMTVDPLRALLHPDDKQRTWRAVQEHLEDGRPYDIEFRLRNKDREYRWFRSRGEALRDENGKPYRMAGSVRDITDRKRDKRAMLQKQEQLDSLLSNVGVIVLEGDPFDIYYVGGQVERILGYPKAQWFGHPEGPVGFWAKHLHPDDEDKIKECLRAIKRGKDHDFEYRMIAADGREVWFYDTVTVETENGKPVRTRSVMVDITERKQAEEAIQSQMEMQKLLMSELDHRVKNTLAAVLSLAEQTIEQSSTLSQFSSTFMGRIRSLARTHEALASRKWTGVELHDLVRLTVPEHAGENRGRIHVDGDSVHLPPEAASPLCMTLHELATNAMKYGALSAPEGRIDISWQSDDSRCVQITWSESNGPAILSEPKSGFGLSLIRGFIEHELQGDVTMNFHTDGLICEVAFSLDRVARAPMKVH